MDLAGQPEGASALVSQTLEGAVYALDLTEPAFDGGAFLPVLQIGFKFVDPYRVGIVPAFTASELTADQLTPERLLARVAAEGQEGLL